MHDKTRYVLVNPANSSHRILRQARYIITT